GSLLCCWRNHPAMTRICREGGGTRGPSPPRGGRTEDAERAAALATLSATQACRLRGGVGECPSVDVRVAEGGRAIRVGSGSRNRPAGSDRPSPGIDRRAVGGVTGIVPYGGTVRIRCHRVDVIAQEFRGQPVLGRSPWIASRAPVDLRPAGRRTPRAEVAVEHDPNEASGA